MPPTRTWGRSARRSSPAGYCSPWARAAGDTFLLSQHCPAIRIQAGARTPVRRSVIRRPTPRIRAWRPPAQRCTSRAPTALRLCVSTRRTRSTFSGTRRPDHRRRSSRADLIRSEPHGPHVGGRRCRHRPDPRVVVAQPGCERHLGLLRLRRTEELVGATQLRAAKPPHHAFARTRSRDCCALPVTSAFASIASTLFASARYALAPGELGAYCRIDCPASGVSAKRIDASTVRLKTRSPNAPLTSSSTSWLTRVRGL